MPVTELFAATTNPGKLRDFHHAAEIDAATPSATPLTIHPLPNLAAIPAPEEDQPTFLDNAILKALYYSRLSPRLTVLADDSGLEVDALHGAPGVRSARYADDHHFPGPPSATNDARNNLCLLEALAHANQPHPAARYRCSLAAARNGLLLATAEGTLEGEILASPRGSSGFGYDPLFYIPELHRTMAELDPATRLAHSHRGRALILLLPKL